MLGQHKKKRNNRIPNNNIRVRFSTKTTCGGVVTKWSPSEIMSLLIDADSYKVPNNCAALWTAVVGNLQHKITTKQKFKFRFANVVKELNFSFATDIQLQMKQRFSDSFKGGFIGRMVGMWAMRYYFGATTMESDLGRI